MEIVELYQIFKGCNTISTDTRKLTKDCMFFALKGESFDGNKFIKQAFEEGAKYCVIDDKNAVINNNCILVEDALATLQKLANYHRNEINIPIISLTGSNGKTTTKELIQTVLSSQYNVKATKGNLNNHIGVPLTLLGFSKDLDFGIVEMGANHLKEIEFLCQIAEPDFGLITNFGKAHLEGFGSLEGIVKGKSEMYDYLKANQKTIFINYDDPQQIKQIGQYPNIVTFGNKTENDCTIAFKEASPFATVIFEGLKIKSKLIGDYNYGNIAVAIAIGKHFNLPAQTIKNAIECYSPKNNRSEIITKGTTTIILDAYNANPTSMLAALKNFEKLEAEKKYLFLGDMFELGTSAENEHQFISEYAEKHFKENIYLIGENFSKTKTSTIVQKFSEFEDIVPSIKKLHLNNATLLIKGSRGMALERILNIL